MTTPTFTTVTDKQDTGDKIYLPWARCKDKLLVVRPLEYQKEGFVTANAPDGTDAAFVDVALLDPIRAAINDEDVELPPFDAGTQFRNQVVLAAYLKGTFKRYLGKTLIGTIYRGVPTKGKPPIMWQDLTGNPECVSRGQQFLMAHPEFLIPVEAQFSEATPEVMPSGGYATGGKVSSGAMYSPHDAGTGPKTQSTLDSMRAMAKANAGYEQEPPF